MNIDKKPVVALVYDFDGTLSPGNMQEFGFIQAIGKEPEEFWAKSAEISRGQDASEILCYMKLMIDEARESGVQLRREQFRDFGSKIPLFDGVEEWFGLMNQYGEEKGLKVLHYINSSGLVEMIEGTTIAKEFEKIYACTFLYDKEGVAEWPGVAIDYTGKTQFIFKINKGVHSISDHKLVNKYVPENERAVPFKQMIYFGDGATDIPCMKLVKQFGGNSIAVYHPLSEDTSDVEKLLSEQRVDFVCPADYTKDSQVYKIVTTIIDKIKAEIDLDNLKK